MLNSYHLNDKFPTDVQPVYVTTCMTPGFFQDLWRTIGDTIFVCIVTSRVYITSMGKPQCSNIEHLSVFYYWVHSNILVLIYHQVIKISKKIDSSGNKIRKVLIRFYSHNTIRKHIRVLSTTLFWSDHD